MISIEQYQAIERENDTKYEYHDGTIFAMAGGSFNHGLIGGNFFANLNTKLLQKNGPCFPLNSDIKLHIASENRFLYPDGMVICDDVERSKIDKEAVTNPTVIIEVLSKSTESYDRGDKFHFYRQISSFKEYLLISQDKYQVEVFTKNENNTWNIQRITGEDAKILISTLGVELEFQAIYRNVKWETPA